MAGNELSSPQFTKGHASGVLCVAWSSDGTRIASGGVDGTLRIWDARGGYPLVECQVGYTVTSVVWSPDAHLVFAAGWAGDVHLWDVTQGVLVARYQTVLGTIYGLALNPDGTYLALAGEERSETRIEGVEVAYIPILDARSGETVLVYRGHSGLWTSGVAWSPSGTLIASAGHDDATVQIWRAQSGEMIATGVMPRERKAVLQVAWSPDEGEVAAGTVWGLRVYEAHTGQQVRQSREEPFVHCVSWSPDGKLIAATPAGDSPTVYDAATCEVVHEYTEEMPADGPKAASIAWSPYGDLIVVGASEGIIRVLPRPETPI